MQANSNNLILHSYIFKLTIRAYNLGHLQLVLSVNYDISARVFKAHNLAFTATNESLPVSILFKPSIVF